MALTVTELYAGSRATATDHTTSTFSCAAGDLLITGFTRGVNADGQQITGCSDNSGSGSWTLLSDQGSNAHDSAWWYKIANGSETTVTVTQSATSVADMFVVKVTGWTGTPTLEGSVGEDESYLVTGASSSIGAGSVTNTTASAIVLALFTGDAPGQIDGSRAVSDGSSYTEATTGGADIQCMLWYRTVSSTGTYTPVYSFSDTGDQAYGAVAVFGDVSAGGAFKAAWARGCNTVLKAA